MNNTRRKFKSINSTTAIIKGFEVTQYTAICEYGSAWVSAEVEGDFKGWKRMTQLPLEAEGLFMKNDKYIEELTKGCNNISERADILEKELIKRIDMVTELCENRKEDLR